MSRHSLRLPARAAVSTIYVETVELWFVCPLCGTALGGLHDPRGQADVICDDCGGSFDVSPSAKVVLTRD